MPSLGRTAGVEIAFDAAWYLSTYRDVARDPLDHYLNEGWKFGYDPCSLLDSSWYLEQNRDVAETGLDPLTHYVEFGWAEGRDPCPLFSTNWYLHWFPGRGAWNPDPMTHFRLGGWESGRGPHPLFDLDWYLTQLGQANLPPFSGDPLSHYLAEGWRANLDPNPLFDTAWYRSLHSGLDEEALDPLSHYVLRGAATGSDPSAIFATAAYAARNPQCGGRAGALAHYLEFGRAEGVALPGSQSPAPSPMPEIDVVVHGQLDAAVRSRSIVIIAAHDQRRIVGAATRHLARAFKDAGFSVLLSYDHPVNVDADALNDCDVVVACDHDGYDFFSWRVALQQLPEEATFDEIIVMNDSVIGPIRPMVGVLDAWRALPFDVTGLLESVDPRPHIQSWGVRFGGRAASVEHLLGFYGKARVSMRKGDLIDFLEIPLAEHFRSCGFSVGSLYSHVCVSSVDRNPAIFGFRELLNAGMPFVKREAFALPAAITWSPTAALREATEEAAEEPVAELIADSLAQIGR